MISIPAPLRQLLSSRLRLSFRQIVLISSLIKSLWLPPVLGAHYRNVSKLFADKINNAQQFHTAVRPVLNQNRPVEVKVAFDIVALVEIRDRSEEFVVNGFATLQWTDQVLTWNPADYGGLVTISPYAKEIWRPRVLVANTMNEDGDVFKDDYHPVFIHHNGSVTWLPGSLFTTSCDLDLRTYPFDSQHCAIKLMSLDQSGKTVRFVPLRKRVGRALYSISGEWYLINSKISAGLSKDIPSFQISFHLERRPGFFLLRVVMPIVLLSFLNLMVFIIPVESGEKVSYGITVLLSLTLFTSTISEGLPASSKTIPFVVIYLIVVLHIAVATVIASILVVALNKMNVKETKRIRAANRLTHRATHCRDRSKQSATENTRGEADLLAKEKNTEEATTTAVKEEANKSFPTGSTSRRVDSAVAAGGAAFSSTRTSAIVGARQSNLPRSSACDKRKTSSIYSTVSNFIRTFGHGQNDDGNEEVMVNKWRRICRYIDLVFFIVFTTMWVGVTTTFFVIILLF